MFKYVHTWIIIMIDTWCLLHTYTHVYMFIILHNLTQREKKSWLSETHLKKKKHIRYLKKYTKNKKKTERETNKKEKKKNSLT